MKSFRGRIARVRAMAYSSDGALLASAGHGGLVRIWDAHGGVVLSRFRVSHRHVTSLSFSPDGSILASTTGYLGARLWSTKDNSNLGVLHENRFAASSLCFLPGTRSVVTGGIGTRPMRGLSRLWGFAAIWDLDSLKSKAHFSESGHVYSTVFHPSGDLVAMGSSEHGILLWDHNRFPDGSLYRESAGPMVSWEPKHRQTPIPKRWVIWQKPVPQCVRFSPDGRLFATTAGWSIRIYDLAEGKKIAILRGHRPPVKTIDFSPDGRTLVSASHDGTIRFWNVETHEERASYDWEMGKVDIAVFAPDGMTIAAGGEGGIVVWDVE